ncbi:MAG: hypothetical protein R2838_11160 [Caldilineaceae bacterium]
MGPTQPGAGRAFRSVLNLHIGAALALLLVYGWILTSAGFPWRWAQRTLGPADVDDLLPCRRPGSGSPRCSSPARSSSCSAAGTGQLVYAG